jgi:hypothetical protein
MVDAAQPASSGPITGRTAILLVVIGVLSFTALLVLGAYAPDMRGRSDPGAQALSRSAVGYAGMVQLLHDLGRPAVVARGPVPTASPSIMVLTIDQGDPATPLRDLPTTRGYRWPILAVLPKWETAPAVPRMDRVRKAGLRYVEADGWVGDGKKTLKLDHLKDFAPHTLVWTGSGQAMATGRIDRMQVFTAMPGWEPMITEPGGGIVLAHLPKSNFYALSDPDLLNTQGISQIANARAGLAILGSLPNGATAPVFFDVTLNGLGRSRSLIKLMVEPPFLAATLSVFMALMLVAWAAFNRFGATRKPERAFALGKRALADNQAALIRMTRREARLGGRYVQAIRDLVARAVAAPRDLDEPGLDAFLDRLGENRGAGDRFTDLARAATTAKTADELQAVAARLYRWRVATAGEGVS